MSHKEQQHQQRGPIRLPILVGSVLWIFAIAALLVVFAGRRNADAPESITAGRRLHPVTGNPSSDVVVAGAPADEQSDPVPVRTWPEAGVLDFELTNHDGETITKQDLLGQPWAVCFVFTRCAGPCPRLAGQMRILQDKLDDTDVRLVTITVDPEYDTPEVMHRFAQAYKADPDRWLFLTGDKELIYRLITESFQMPVAEAGGSFLHSNNIMHVNAEGQVVAKYNGLKEDDMIELYRALRAEADSGGEPPDKPKSEPASETTAPLSKDSR